MSFPYDKFKALSIEQVNDTRISQERYYRNRQRGNKASFFMINLTTPPIPYSEYMPLVAVINGYEGSLELFDLPNPFPALASNPSVAVNQSANKGVKQIKVTGQPNYQAGDFIQIDNHTKAYQIMSTSIDGLNLLVNLSSPLVADITTSEQVVYGSNVIFQMCLNSTLTADIDASNSKFGVIDIEVIEQA